MLVENAHIREFKLTARAKGLFLLGLFILCLVFQQGHELRSKI